MPRLEVKLDATGHGTVLLGGAPVRATAIKVECAVGGRPSAEVTLLGVEVDLDLGDADVTARA